MQAGLVGLGRMGSRLQTRILTLIARVLDQNPDSPRYRRLRRGFGRGAMGGAGGGRARRGADIIAQALFRRFESQDDAYATRPLAALRDEFGAQGIRAAGGP